MAANESNYLELYLYRRLEFNFSATLVNIANSFSHGDELFVDELICLHEGSHCLRQVFQNVICLHSVVCL